MENRVFLGGTCADSTWRSALIRVLEVEYFNPVVEDWTPACITEEDFQKAEKCNVHLYVITKEMQGVYSIAEVVDSVKTPGKLTILHVVPAGFSEAQIKSFEAVAKMVRENGGIAYVDPYLSRTATILNNAFK